MKRGLNPELGLAILRVVLGVIFIAHGYPKIAAGAAGTGEFFAQLGIPLAGFFAWVVTLLEVFGGVALVIGFLVTPISLLLAFHMLVGIILVHAPNGFYVIGPGQGGIEFNLVLIAGLLALVFAGPGMAALDSRTGGGEEAVSPAGAEGTGDVEA